MILRSTAWDGPAPAPGDVVAHESGFAVVREVAAGPGVGHWRMTCDPARLIRWTGQVAQPDAPPARAGDHGASADCPAMWPADGQIAQDRA